MLEPNIDIDTINSERTLAREKPKPSEMVEKRIGKTNISLNRQNKHFVLPPLKSRKDAVRRKVIKGELAAIAGHQQIGELDESASEMLLSKKQLEVPEKKNLVIQIPDLGPDTSHYKIVNGEHVVGYQRETILPPIEEVQSVVQGTYAVAGGETGKRYLETGQVSPCVVVTLYEPSTKKGVMAHFDSRSKVLFALRDMRKEFGEGDHGLEMRIVGGYIEEKSSAEIVKEIQGVSASRQIPIVEQDVLKSGLERSDVSVALDTMTGELFDLPKHYLLQYPSEHSRKLSKKLHEITEEDPLGKAGIVQRLNGL